MTSNELWDLHRRGARLIKLFHASMVTPPVLKSMLSVTPLRAMNIAPSGGASPENIGRSWGGMRGKVDPPIFNPLFFPSLPRSCRGVVGCWRPLRGNGLKSGGQGYPRGSRYAGSVILTFRNLLSFRR